MLRAINQYMADDSGATAIEYALIAALISIVIIGGATIVGTSLNATFNNVASLLG